MSKNAYLDGLSQLLETQKKIRTVSSIFDNHYPVAIVVDNTFEVYDITLENDRYTFIKSAPCPFPIPQGVRAAFPLECYGERTSAVISPDAFDMQEGYVFILHEFVHCAQSMECESTLKDQLSIAREYKQKNDYMWEINHPFPYEQPTFEHLFTKYMDVLSAHNYQEIEHMRHQLSGVLSRFDFEYMLWQEWKEGFARFLENKIRNRLGIQENHRGVEMPFNRISFYESGSRLLTALEKKNSNIVNDMRKAFGEMAKTLILTAQTQK